MRCNKNNASVKWIWTIDEQMLNLKTLKCLRGDKVLSKNRKRTIKKFSMEQCNISSLKQKWVCTERSLEQQGTRVKNKGTLKFTSDWIKPNDSSYFKNCGQQIYSYRGNVYFTPGYLYLKRLWV